MSETEFLCLGVPRSGRGFYALGIDLMTGEWVRAVRGPYGLSLDRGQVLVMDSGSKRRMRPLDVVRVRFGNPVPGPNQRENRILERRTTDDPIPVLRHAGESEDLLREIRKKVYVPNSAEPLMGSYEASSPISEDFKVSMSICVIQPRHLMWRKTIEYRKGRDYLMSEGLGIQGELDFGEERYCLPVSDVSWESSVRRLMPDRRFIDNKDVNEFLSVPLETETFLTISLGDDDIEFMRQYRFIAGVFYLSQQ